MCALFFILLRKQSIFFPESLLYLKLNDFIVTYERSLFMDFNKLAEMRDRDNLFAAFLGIKTKKVEEGYAEVELELRP